MTIVRFWNRVAGMRDSEWVHKALKESITMIRHSGAGKPRCWAGLVVSMCRSLGLAHAATDIENWALAQGVGGALAVPVPQICEDEVMVAWDTKWEAQYGRALHPRHTQCSDVKWATYAWWMAAPTPTEMGSQEQGRDAWYPAGMPRYVRYTYACNQEHMRSLAKFRCGAHDRT